LLTGNENNPFINPATWVQLFRDNKIRNTQLLRNITQKTKTKLPPEINSEIAKYLGGKNKYKNVRTLG